MITPGKDDNYPGAQWSSQGATSYLPHTLLGMTLAVIVVLFGYHLLKGGRRR